MATAITYITVSVCVELDCWAPIVWQWSTTAIAHLISVPNSHRRKWSTIDWWWPRCSAWRRGQPMLNINCEIEFYACNVWCNVWSILYDWSVSSIFDHWIDDWPTKWDQYRAQSLCHWIPVSIKQISDSTETESNSIAEPLPLRVIGVIGALKCRKPVVGSVGLHWSKCTTDSCITSCSPVWEPVSEPDWADLSEGERSHTHYCLTAYYCHWLPVHRLLSNTESMHSVHRIRTGVKRERKTVTLKETERDWKSKV